jgi:nucleotide-binding universal stress UspA family protein
VRPPPRATEPRALSRPIVVPVGSPPWSRWAIPFAATLGRGTRAGLVLYWAIASEGQREQAQYRLDTIVADLGGSGLPATTRIDCRADVAQGILEAAAATDAALIALATKSKSHLDRWLNDSVADEVLRQADVPVLIVPHGLTHLWPTHVPLRILVPLDGSPLAAEVLPTTRTLAESLGAEVVLFDRLIRTGQPADEIVAAARAQGAHLIAMATHGRGGLARLRLGSVATATLHRSTVPVLVVRPGAAPFRLAP